MTRLYVGKVGEKPSPESLTLMRNRGGTWAAYQNHALGSVDVGHLQFLKFGPGCTYETAPPRFPDTDKSTGWRYVLVGTVNLTTGEVESNVETKEIGHG